MSSKLDLELTHISSGLPVDIPLVTVCTRSVRFDGAFACGVVRSVDISKQEDVEGGAACPVH